MTRLSLRTLQIGATATVLVATILRDFELDRFFVPKEIALHVTAVVATLCALRLMRDVPSTWLDKLLILYLMLSAVSAVFATNIWLGARALAVSASAVAIFWAARALSRAGYSRQVLIGLAIAIVVAAITSLAQAYGIRLDLFATSRAPGGTSGAGSVVVLVHPVSRTAHAVRKRMCIRARQAMSVMGILQSV